MITLCGDRKEARCVLHCMDDFASSVSLNDAIVLFSHYVLLVFKIILHPFLNYYR
jgi:hypothetical protein